MLLFEKVKYSAMIRMATFKIKPKIHETYLYCNSGRSEVTAALARLSAHHYREQRAVITCSPQASPIKNIHVARSLSNIVASYCRKSVQSIIYICFFTTSTSPNVILLNVASGCVSYANRSRAEEPLSREAPNFALN